jgi:hypothetical protein
MMKKNAIALAVATVCATPLVALAAGATQAGLGHWEVITPSSPNEAAPQLAFSRSHLGSAPTLAAAQTETATAVAEVVTPLSVDESPAWPTAETRRKERAALRTKVVSLPNPQTPWSPNESGPDRYAEDMRAYRQHVASVEQARIATAAANAASEAAAVAAAQPAPVDPATTAELDRLLANPSSTPRDREAVATVSPALVDSRQSAATELRPETAPSDRPAPEAAASSMPADAARTAEAAPAPAPIGANTVAAASSSVSGSTAAVSVAPAPLVAAPIAAIDTPAPAGTMAAPEAAAQPPASAPAQ